MSSIKQTQVWDKNIITAFDYAFGRTSFVRDTTNYIWTNWGNISEGAKKYILDKLMGELKKYDDECFENTLLSTFTTEQVIYKGRLGNSQSAGYWKGLYNLVGDSIVVPTLHTYQEPPDTKSNSSHFPVV